MGVVRAKIQTVEEIYAIVWKAVTGRRPIAAVYHRRRRLLCPHRLGRNNAGQLRVLCYQYGGESQRGLEPPGSPSNWRCIVLEKLSRVEILEDNIWQTAPNHSRPQTCVPNADVDAEDYPAEGMRTLRKHTKPGKSERA
ncbi:MAG: hypothetical protein KJZ78_04920 [Bryobacteraceae bacterium]|nr:hypothetical protein [Bryobacteraceae bacterium]